MQNQRDIEESRFRQRFSRCERTMDEIDRAVSVLLHGFDADAECMWVTILESTIYVCQILDGTGHPIEGLQFGFTEDEMVSGQGTERVRGAILAWLSAKR